MDTEFKADLLTLVRTAMRQELGPLKDELLLQRQELVKQRQELQLQRAVLGAIDLRTRKMQVQINSLNVAMRAQAKEIKRLDVLLEDLNERFATVRKLSWD